MSNSLVDLLARLQQGDVMLDWGAILSFSRDELNRIIKEQYIKGFEGLRFLLPFSEAFPVNDDGTEQVELRGIVLGGPTLSFESASLNTATLTLTLGIVNGTFTHFRHGTGVPPTVLNAFSITEDMGFNVSMQASVHEIQGQVDKHGIVTLDLALVDKVICNLGSVKKIQELIGGYFLSYFAGEAEQRRRFVLGRLELNKYNPLSPTRFAIRVQRAPGADNPQATQYGDGVVVVFIKLKVQDGDPVPGIPGEGGNFPYLVPDDREDGEPVYSASLMINHELLSLVDEEQLDLLKSLIFPNQNVFEEIRRSEPHDLAVFGNVKPSSRSVVIEPSMTTLMARQSQLFVARRGDGSIVSSVQWKVSSPDYPVSMGSITSNGVYTASAQSAIRRHRLPIVVTATYVEDGQEKVSSALVMERFQSMSIAPLVQVKSGIEQTPLLFMPPVWARARWSSAYWSLHWAQGWSESMPIIRTISRHLRCSQRPLWCRRYKSVTPAATIGHMPRLYW